MNGKGNLKMITLQYKGKNGWKDVEEFGTEKVAWMSLGADNFNYRTVSECGQVLTDKSDPKTYKDEEAFKGQSPLFSARCNSPII